MNTSILQRLKERVNCDVITPRDGEYDEQRTPWLHVVNQLPLAIVNAANADDIAATVRFARENDLELAIQNTGHGIAAPCNSGILLRLAGMKQIAVDAERRTATIGPGVKSGELLAQPSGLAWFFPPAKPPTSAPSVTPWAAASVGSRANWARPAALYKARLS